MDAEGWLEVSRLMERVFEAVSQRVAVGTNKIRFHFTLADHAIPVKKKIK
jgi:hypothetical protein